MNTTRITFPNAKGELLAEAGEDQMLCAGSSAKLTGKGRGGKSPFAYRWADDARTEVSASPAVVVSPRKTTRYFLTVTDAHGCTNTDSVLITVYDPLIAVAGDDIEAQLRPETAQGIFVNFKHVLDSTSRKLPFGIAQIGKAFRNEINPRNFTFRSREFEQMELEFFIKPDEAIEAISGSVAKASDVNPQSAICNPQLVHFHPFRMRTTAFWAASAALGISHFLRSRSSTMFEMPRTSSQGML